MPKDPYCDLAKKAVEAYITGGEKISTPSSLPKRLLSEKGGVFVTLKKDGKLRGCIGTHEPSKENLGREIIFNAIAAATRDPRFSKVTKEELKDLSYTVYILSKPRQVTDLKQLDPQNYGIIALGFPKGAKHKTLDSQEPNKKGLLLPDLEGINTAHEQVETVCDKAGINPDQEAIALYRFEAEKYEEEE